MADMIQYSVDEHIAKIVLNRPAANTLDEPAARLLYEAVQDARMSDEVRVIYLTGSGGVFCGGLDLRSVDLSDTDTIVRLHRSLFDPIAKEIYSCAKPVVCAMNGSASGAGLMFALACDLTYAVEQSRLAFTFVERGLIPACGGTYLIPALVGEKKALEIVLRAKTYKASNALAEGLLTGVYATVDELARETYQIAQELAGRSPLVLNLVKKAMRSRTIERFDEQLRLEEELQAVAVAAPSFREGVEKFLKR